MTVRLVLKLIWAAFFLMASLSSATAQQTAEPIVEVELSETEVIPGQPVILRVTVLVPTWLPKPVSFPTFEVPDLMVKLPERATNPLSRTVDGETWSGVSRAYRISPMVPSPLAIPEQELTIFWAEPGKPDPLITKTPVPAMTITGLVPDGAEGLDPFIAATDLKLTQTVSSENRTLQPGDSLTREVVLEVEGTSPLFLPKLLPTHDITGIASYPSEPDVTEKTSRTWISGTRKESTTLVAESGGSGSVPAIELRWYNIETKTVETARVDGFDLTVDGPIARERPDIDPRFLVVIAGLCVVLLYGVFRVSKWFFPWFRIWRQNRKNEREATETWAYQQVREAVSRQDYGAVTNAITVWKARLPARRDVDDTALQAALLTIGQNLFGSEKSASSSAWRGLSKSLADYRSRCVLKTKRTQEGNVLAMINPR